MPRTRMRVLRVLGLTLILGSLLLGRQSLGYFPAVLMMQVGGLSLVLGLFFRLREDATRKG